MKQITGTDRNKIITHIEGCLKREGRKPGWKELAILAPGYGQQQYAALIAHVTMGSYAMKPIELRRVLLRRRS